MFGLWRGGNACHDAEAALRRQRPQRQPGSGEVLPAGDLADAPLHAYRGNSIYEAAPSSAAPYSAGKVKAEVLQATLDRLNMLRRIAGLPSVELDAVLTNYAQHGAVISAVNNQLFRQPSKPAGMDDAFFKCACTGTSSSNLAMGYTLIGAIDGWMDDSDAPNIDRLGRRRWQLNPDNSLFNQNQAWSATVNPAICTVRGLPQFLLCINDFRAQFI